MPSSELVVEGMILCESTLEAIALTSSGAQYERPFAAARALEAASSILLARGEARQYGGAGRLMASVVLESVLATLLAPIRMAFHSRFVLLNLMGREVPWISQRREDRRRGA